ncbi:MAG: sulfotransferase [Woeseiaceae bacterium]|nr:sulfotransferase [Woeseiaceae bacterium]
MPETIDQIAAAGRHAVRAQDWGSVAACANEIIRRDANSAEGYFLGGLVERVQQHPRKAIELFQRALDLDPERYDAAVELANQYSIARRNADVADLLARFEDKMSNSPMYLDLAGTIYTEIGMPERAWPLYEQAVKLQPTVDLFQANLAACAVFLGKIDEATEIFERLLERFPDHQRNHWQLSRLHKAKDDSHIRRMQEIIERKNLPPDQNVYLYYAIGKQFEDLERWDEAFEYYEKGGDAVCSVAEYDGASDIAIIDKIIEVCDADWLGATDGDTTTAESAKTPIFIIGLPRTGTTLTERIISSHSQVESLGETQFLQMVLRRESGVETMEAMIPDMIEAVAQKDMGIISRGYMEAAGYRLDDSPFFIDKLPFNFLYAGFIARAWPDARIVSLVRNPMDSCFSMYKQVFTWAYKFSYSLELLGPYFAAYERLRRHWRDVLGDRYIEVVYEDLVADQEQQTRQLLDRLGLDFEDACLNFDKNRAPTATASNIQVREKAHTRSVQRWKRFEKQLQPLRDYLENAGITVE